MKIPAITDDNSTSDGDRGTTLVARHVTVSESVIARNCWPAAPAPGPACTGELAARAAYAAADLRSNRDVGTQAGATGTVNYRGQPGQDRVKTDSELIRP